MKHEPAASAAGYLAGELSAPEHEVFEGHLIGCDDCWTEVHAGRRGIRLARQAREYAPPELRERIRETTLTADANRSAQLRIHLALAAALLVGVLIGVTGTVLSLRKPVREEHDEQPKAIAAAVAGYRHGRLPGSDIPRAAAPNLSSLRLDETAAAGGRLADQPVTAYAYRDAADRRLLVYISERQFPVPYESRQVTNVGSLWIGHDGNVTIVCGRRPTNTLIVGEDEVLVRAAAKTLHMT